MNSEDLQDALRTERHETRTMEDEIADLRDALSDAHTAAEAREDDVHNLDTIIQNQLRENAAIVSTNNLLRRLLRKERVELERLRIEHAHGRKMRAVPDTRSPEFIDSYRPWADAHDRTELAK